MKWKTRSGCLGSRTKARLTLEDVEAIMAETDQAIFPVVGDCLEGPESRMEDG